MGKKAKPSKTAAEKYKRLQDAFSNFDPEGVTVLTGNNGSGKSLFRKQLPFAFQQYCELDSVDKTKGMIKSTSMDARTTSNPEWGALSSVLTDTSWIATSQNTFSSICKLFNAAEGSSTTMYVVIDEYEIGCSEETILALARYINDRIKKLIADKKIIGAMIITHSRIGMREIEHDHFVNLEGLTEQQWLSREIVPTDLDELEANELFFYIRDHKQK
jgi:hypothetical protein